MTENTAYIHALRFPCLNRYYDCAAKITTREKTFKRQLLRFIDPQHTRTLLDLACGTGTLAIAVKQAHPVIAVSAVDGDANILQQAKSKAASSNTAIQWHHAMAQQLPFADNSFDTVTSTLFFHHLNARDKRGVLGELQRVLRPGGQLLIADWGATGNSLLRANFYLVQFLDGFKTTSDNIKGKLPAYIEHAGFSDVVIEKKLPVPLGAIDIIQAAAPS